MNKSQAKPRSPIATIVLIAIAFLLIPLVIQNWKPAIVIVLGLEIYAVPLSLSILAALIGGGILAFSINLIFQPRFDSAKKNGNSAQIPKVSSQPDSRYDDNFDQLDDFEDDYIETKYTKK
jgi:uncharacterized integral membrane protein